MSHEFLLRYGFTTYFIGEQIAIWEETALARDARVALEVRL
jgi:hypothetical protein